MAGGSFAPSFHCGIIGYTTGTVVFTPTWVPETSDPAPVVFNVSASVCRVSAQGYSVLPKGVYRGALTIAASVDGSPIPRTMRLVTAGNAEWDIATKIGVSNMSGRNHSADLVGIGLSGPADIRSLATLTTGKKYFEVRITQGSEASDTVTIGIRPNLPSAGPLANAAGCGAGWESAFGLVFSGGAFVSSTGVTGGASNPIIGVAVEFTGANVLVWIAKNNVWMLSGNPATGASPLITLPLATYYMAAGVYAEGTNGRDCQLLAIEDSQYYSPPSGFTAAATDTVTWGPTP